MLIHITRDIGLVARVEPLVEGVVEAHFDPPAPDRLGQVSAEVTVWADIDAVPVPAVRTRPETEALMMLGGEHDVLGTRPREDVGPLSRIEKLGLEHGGEILVLEL